MATLAEIASRAGVGIGTVSRVLSGSANVSDAMRARVTAAADELGYERPSRRKARNGASDGLVGVLVAFFDAPSVQQRFAGLVPRLQANGLHMVLYNVVSPAQAREVLGELPRSSHLDGLVVVSLPLDADDVSRLRRSGLPTVLLDSSVDGLSSVSIDDREGGRMATQHLLDLGHRRIGFVGEPGDNPFGFVSSARREDGYRDALVAAGVDPDPRYVRHGAHLRQAAKQMGLDLLSLDEPPTAIVASSDVQAIGVLEAAGQRGLRVPDDLSVVGYDDIDLAAPMGLTTVRQPLERSGARAADLVVSAIGTPGATVASVPSQRAHFDEQMDLELVARTTTRPPR
ncbi:MAG: LacI family DNA-binding transcriptional regulator [Ilumatobacteraceae bacterium]